MKLSGRLLLFEIADKNCIRISKDCKISIPEKTPLLWDFDEKGVLGIAEAKQDNKGLVFNADMFANPIYEEAISSILHNNDVGCGGYYDKVKFHMDGDIRVIDEATLRSVSLTPTPVDERYTFEVVE